MSGSGPPVGAGHVRARAAGGRAGAAGVPRARAPARRRAALPARAGGPRLPRQAAHDGGATDLYSFLREDILMFLCPGKGRVIGIDEVT